MSVKLSEAHQGFSRARAFYDKTPTVFCSSFFTLRQHYYIMSKHRSNNDPLIFGYILIFLLSLCIVALIVLGVLR
jgi:hypothetical protein